ncbi:unnamed protein product [Arabidopsis lyrata]|uniref:Uncharacterized protein n=1 Tax=Arabidopsis lyrata subsp. lyrata TaxID=81972 RepID=D7ME67_ARALL|nr:uncharacterized protein LOC9303857 [Arabidopsis lyrata subsp. lyrata]EFH44044.1 hypothetical protein ARALYDRAFT_914401 [Arabidopsis lyrata subsp. lyrata]CAH8275747.1 unnamed protein product [Arabidopsis lyrata]|eukprot:XP_002867785.1 uncharacterized protein LOC9303857 [Arabidopsis lyrata subsp. lyrata]
MDSPTSIRSKPPPEILSPCGSQRRRSSCDSNPPEFEFWRLTNTSFPQADSDLLSADELFHDGVLLPLHLLSVKSELPSDPNIVECDPDASPSPVTLITEQKNDLEPGLGSELTRETTVSKRWRDIFRKSETKPPGKKEKVKENKKEKKKTGSGSGSGSGSGAELNINIWPFSRSRSAGNNVTRPRMSFGAPTTRKVSSAPCSRSNSTGESKSRKWPSSPGRNGVHLGRSSPVWQVRRGGGAPVGKTIPEPMGRVVGKREIPETRKGKTVIESNKAKVLNLNVPMCIGYRSRLSCRTEESGGGNSNIGSDNNNNNANANNPNPNGLFGFRNLFIKKVY